MHLLSYRNRKLLSDILAHIEHLPELFLSYVLLAKDHF